MKLINGLTCQVSPGRSVTTLQSWKKITFLKKRAREPVFLGLLGVLLLLLGVVGADDGLTGLDVGDTMAALGAKTLPACGDVTCTAAEVLGITTA